MKKVVKAAMVAMCIFALAGCAKDDGDGEESAKVISFEEYLESREVYTAAKLDSKIPPIDFSEDPSLSDLDITKSKVTLTNDGESVDAYLWTKIVNGDKFAYFGMEEGTSTNSINLSKIDEKISEIKEEALNENPIGELLEDINNSGKIEFSEIFDNYLDTMDEEGDDITLDDILAKIDFDINDFEDKKNGVYKLKASAIAEIAGETETATPDVIEYIEEIMQIHFKYKNNNVEEIKFNIVGEDALDTPRTTTMIFNFEYDSKNEVTKTTIKFVSAVSKAKLSLSSGNRSIEDEEISSAPYVNVKFTFGNHGFSFEAKTGDSAVNIDDKISFSRTLENGKNTIKAKVLSDGIIVLDLNVGIIGSWVSEGSISMYDEEEDAIVGFSVVSNVNIDIPSELMSMENEDLTEKIMETIESKLNG